MTKFNRKTVHENPKTLYPRPIVAKDERLKNKTPVVLSHYCGGKTGVGATEDCVDCATRWAKRVSLVGEDK